MPLPRKGIISRSAAVRKSFAGFLESLERHLVVVLNGVGGYRIVIR